MFLYSLILSALVMFDSGAIVVVPVKTTTSSALVQVRNNGYNENDDSLENDENSDESPLNELLNKMNREMVEDDKKFINRIEKIKHHKNHKHTKSNDE